MNPRIEVASLDSFTLRLFEHIDATNMPWLLAAAQRLRERFGDDLLELVPSYTTLLLRLSPERLQSGEIRAQLRQALDGLRPLDRHSSREVEIPVWYHGSVGPDLDRLARQCRMEPEELIRRHSEGQYDVFALGFAPGFAFMGMVDERIASPRLATPRQRVSAGSVGIAERQTAVYPLTSPGGWNLIGRTPAQLFDRRREGYSLLQPGDRVRFVSVDRGEFLRLGGDISPMDDKEPTA